MEKGKAQPGIHPQPVGQQHFVFRIQGNFVAMNQGMRKDRIIHLRNNRILIPGTHIALFGTKKIEQVIASHPDPVVDIRAIVKRGSQTHIFHSRTIMPFLKIDLSALIRR